MASARHAATCCQEHKSTNKAVVYDLLFCTAADTLLAIAADPKHLGARIGLTAVLHTWAEPA